MLLALTKAFSLSPFISKALTKLVGTRVLDLCLHVPLRQEERFLLKVLSEGADKQLVTIALTVQYHLPRATARAPYRVVLSDEKNQHIELIYFKSNTAYIKQLLPVGKKLYISGTLEKDKGLFPYKMTHPDYVGADFKPWVGLQPIYPLTAGITQSFIRRLIAKSLERLQDIPEWLSPSILSAEKFPRFKESVVQLHTQKNGEELNKRLAFDELLAHQLSLILSSRKYTQKENHEPYTVHPKLAEVIQSLPYALTNGQKTVLHEIISDFGNPYPMVRLLQGDVGSGKTVVALISMMDQILKGGQCAFLVPTEILARQHFESIKKLLGNYIKVGLLTSKEPAKQKRQVLEDLENHNIDLIVGTHALIQDSVIFKNLTYCVVDEQHRFGVEQRLALCKKGKHLLSMTATPIPRTLTLACYGDMDVSLLKEKPAGRKPITTTVLSLDRYGDLKDRLKSQTEAGAQCYWVCPVIEENAEFSAVLSRFEDLASTFQNVGLVHGKIKDKDSVMQDFKDRKISILVATTVIEVGVDVPNATIMVIENAERFGLAQLHQLRGRVGRGVNESYCILLYKTPLSFNGQKRLEVMKKHDDGFKLAELDLKMRGSGEITGTQQSGMLKFRFSDFETDPEACEEMLEKAHAYAWELCQNEALSTEFENAKTHLLEIFEKKDHYSKSG